MHKQIDKLMLIQDKDIQIKDFLDLTKALPEKLHDCQKQLADSQNAVARAKEKLKVIQVERKKYELEVETIVAKRQKLEGQLYSLKTNQEYKTMEKEIFGLKVNVQKIENDILRYMEEGEQQEQVVKEKEDVLKKYEEKVRIEEKEIESKILKTQEDLKNVRAEREILVQDIDPAFLRRYERIFERVKERAIVQVSDRNCKGCHTLLPPQVIVDVRKSDDITLCDNCGRILVYSETSDSTVDL